MQTRELGRSGPAVSAVARGKLSPADVARVETAMPAHAVTGDRYGTALMTHLDSES